jgi:hypothetical protein
MVLGSDIGLEETVRMALCGLVGRVSYSYLCKVSIPLWVEQNWVPLIGYAPEILYLTKGWLGFICKAPEDLSILLENRWVLGGSSLMLKRWRVAFDPATEYFQQRHLWVLLPGLPIHLWNEGALTTIGNSLDTFITVDRQNLTAPVRKVGRILVEMDIHCGLPEVLEIEWRGRKILQRLDYLGIPFRCSLCHSTGHLRKDCNGWVAEDESEDTTVHRDIYNTPPEEYSFRFQGLSLFDGGHKSTSTSGYTLG